MKVNIKYISSGMELSQDVYPNNNSRLFIVPAGRVLTGEDIEKIKERGVDEVSININDESQTFGDVFQKIVRETIDSRNITAIQEMATKYKEIAERSESYAIDMKRYITDDFDSKTHIINTTNMAVIVAAAHNSITSKTEQIPLDQMAEAAMLQDIGCMAKDEKILARLRTKYGFFINELRKSHPKIPAEVLDKYDSDYHSLYSFLILTDNNFDVSVIKAVLYHHEKYANNAGPMGIPLSLLDQRSASIQMSMILKMCDLYDLILYKGKELDPDQPFRNIPALIDAMVANGFVSSYWANLLKTVLPVYQVGTKVLLSDGTIGIVYEINPNNILKPKIKDMNSQLIDMTDEALEIVGPVITEEEPEYARKY